MENIALQSLQICIYLYYATKKLPLLRQFQLTNVISINDLDKSEGCTIYCQKNRIENYVTENMILYCRKFELNAPSDVLSIDVFLSYNILLTCLIYLSLDPGLDPSKLARRSIF